MYRTFDLRLAKSVPVGGDRRISVSAEAFNILNWDNYSGFVGRATDANYGKKSGAFAPRQEVIEGHRADRRHRRLPHVREKRADVRSEPGAQPALGQDGQTIAQLAWFRWKRWI